MTNPLNDPGLQIRSPPGRSLHRATISQKQHFPPHRNASTMSNLKNGGGTRSAMATSRSPDSFPHQIPSTLPSPFPAVADPRGAGGQQTARGRRKERGKAASYSALSNTCGSWRKMCEDSKRRSVGWRNWERALERLPFLEGRKIREAAIRTSGSRSCRSLVEGALLPGGLRCSPC